MATKESLGVTAIIVTYHPNLLHLNKVIARIFSEVDSILVVDNHSPEVSRWKIPQKNKAKIHTIKLPDNLGIGYAQNLGIEWAHKKKSRYVLFLDQDSLPTKGMTQKLKNALQRCPMIEARQVLAAGPMVIDLHTKEITPFEVNKKLNRLKKNSPVVAVKSLIASGMLVDLNAFKLIGGMRSDYFIDAVDTEWVHRLNRQGYVAIGVKDAFLYHSNGESMTKVSFLRGKIKFEFNSHKPFRNYYRIRNKFLMRKDLKNPIDRIFCRELILLTLFFLFLDNHRMERLKFVCLGWWHGLLNIRGKLNIKSLKCTKIPMTTLDLT
jgi:rhamnosyltransferase